jgi:hypothetical protein
MIVRIDFHTGNLHDVRHMYSLTGPFASIFYEKY